MLQWGTNRTARDPECTRNVNHYGCSRVDRAWGMGWHVWVIYDDSPWREKREKKEREKKKMSVHFHYYPFPRLAYGCNYYASYATKRTLCNRRRVPPHSSSFSAITNLFFQNPNFITGNTLFLRMKVIIVYSNHAFSFLFAILLFQAKAGRILV